MIGDFVLDWCEFKIGKDSIIEANVSVGENGVTIGDSARIGANNGIMMVSPLAIAL